MEAREVVGELWRQIQARDWDGLGSLLARDFSVDWPDTGLRIRGRENFIEFDPTYPEGWTIEGSRSLPTETRLSRKHVLGSQASDASAWATRELASRQELQYGSVELGAVRGGGHERWLTNDEISEGVYAAIVADRRHHLVGATMS